MEDKNTFTAGVSNAGVVEPCNSFDMAALIEVLGEINTGCVWESYILPHMLLQGACTNLLIVFERSVVGL